MYTLYKDMTLNLTFYKLYNVTFWSELFNEVNDVILAESYI